MGENNSKTRNKSRRPHHEGRDNEHFNEKNSQREPDQHETRQPERKHEASRKETRIPMQYRFGLTVAGALLAGIGSLNVVAAKAAEYKGDRAPARVEFKIDNFALANADRRKEVRLDMSVNFRGSEAREAQFTRFAVNFDREAWDTNFARNINLKAEFRQFTTNRDREELLTNFGRGFDGQKGVIDREVGFTRFGGNLDGEVGFTRFAGSLDREVGFTRFAGNLVREAPVGRFQSYNRTQQLFGLFNQINAVRD